MEQSSIINNPPDMHLESNRIKTFEKWPNPHITPLALAQAGFYYLNRSDEVKCAWCKGVIAKWESQDNPTDEHRRFFPHCPRVQLGPLIEIASEGIRDLGIQQITPPKKPTFSSLDARLRTYSNWPISDIQKPEKLAQAGLYYQNVDDQVRCFHCNIGLRSWQVEDDPWFEHAKWSSDCQFVRLVKGANYLQQVQETIKQSPHSHVVLTNLTLEEAMSTPPIQQALQIGIDVGSLRLATQKRLLNIGRPYETVEELIKAVFDETENREGNSHDNNTRNIADSDIGACSSSVQEVSRIFSDTFGIYDNHQTCLPSTSNYRQNGMPPTSLSSSSNDININTDEDKLIGESLKNNLKNLSNNNENATRNSTSCIHSTLEEENRRLKDARLCKVCLDEEVGVVFLPCGHLVTCVQCANGVSQCPMCRTFIKGLVRTYLS